MDSKRIIIAVVLSMAVLIGWNFIFPPQKPVQTQQAQTEASAPGAGQTQVAEPITPELPSPAFIAGAGRDISVDTPLYTAVFTSQGGVLKHFQLKKYKVTMEPDSELVDLITPTALNKAPMGLLINLHPTWQDSEWTVDAESLTLDQGQTGKLTFSATVEGLTLTRVFSFSSDSYVINENLDIDNPSATTAAANLSFTLAATDLTTDENKFNKTAISILSADGRVEENSESKIADGLVAGNAVKWGGIGNNYFFLAMAPEFDGAAFKAKLEDGVYRAGVDRGGMNVPAGGRADSTMVYYLGPKLADQLSKAPNDLESALSYGWFDFISKPLLLGINFFNRYTHNYGLAIIMLTILLKILLWPLSHKSYKSMREMQKLQPMLAKLREKYKDDKAKLQQETMALFKTYKVNPAGGCFPMLLQFPIFLGLYQALLRSLELRHATFISHVPFTDIVWLADLSAKDPFYVTPLIMGATMFLQQKMTPSTGDPTQAKIMLLMPVVFTFLFLNFPAGLVIYWLTQNILSIGQQWWMLKKA